MKIEKYCNNKLTLVQINNKIILVYSYNTNIGIIYNNHLILNEYYINYSKTTSKHIYYIKYDLYYFKSCNIITCTYKTFNNIIDNNYNINVLDNIIKKHDNNYYSLEYIKEFKEDINNNNYKSFNERILLLDKHIELINNKRISIINTNNLELKTRYKDVITYKINNYISFDIIKTYKKNKGGAPLINIKCNNIKAAAV